MSGIVWLVAFAFIVGCVAQLWKGRLGALWMLLSLAVVGAGGQWLMGVIANRYEPERWAQAGVRRPMYVAAHALPAVVVLLAMVVVPKKQPREQPSTFPTDDRLRRKCPHCAEMILAEARVCQHCGGRVRPILEGPDLPTLPSGPPTPPPPKADR